MSGAPPAHVKRVVFKEIAEGDYRKFEAHSNDADSGGGARDLRFRPYEKFREVFLDLFPLVRAATRRRGGVDTEVKVLVGRLYWPDGDTVASAEATFEPPTDARPNEGRIPVVHTYPPFSDLPSTNQGKVVLLLIQRDDDTVWPSFATEGSLRSGAWEPSVATPILASLKASRPTNQVARGYIDFARGTMFSDA